MRLSSVPRPVRALTAGALLGAGPGLLAPAPVAAAVPSAGAYEWPLPAPHPVVRLFDPPSSTWGPGHRGVDLGGRGGEPVRSAAAGVVVYAGPVGGRGVVVVRHAGGLRTTYEPVLATLGVGAAVARGQPLGRLTLWSSHCLPRACLHWGALRGATYLDPLTLLGLHAGPVRLLPLHPSASGGRVAGGGWDAGPGLTATKSLASGGALAAAVAPPVRAPSSGAGRSGAEPTHTLAGTRTSRGAAAGLGLLAATALVVHRRRAPPQPQSSAGRSRASRS